LLKPYFHPQTLLLLLSYLLKPFHDCNSNTTITPPLLLNFLTCSHFFFSCNSFQLYAVLFLLPTCLYSYASFPSNYFKLNSLPCLLFLLCQVSSIIPTCGSCSMITQPIPLLPFCVFDYQSNGLKFCRFFFKYCLFTQFRSHGLTCSSGHSFR